MTKETIESVEQMIAAQDKAKRHLEQWDDLVCQISDREFTGPTALGHKLAEIADYLYDPLNKYHYWSKATEAHRQEVKLYNKLQEVIKSRYEKNTCVVSPICIEDSSIVIGVQVEDEQDVPFIWAAIQTLNVTHHYHLVFKQTNDNDIMFEYTLNW